MKKNLTMLLMAAMLSMVFIACGDDKDEPVVPTQNLESVYQSESETHFLFDIDLDKDSSSIYLYNVIFTIGEVESPAMNIRIDAPVTVDKSGKIYTYAGTGITPFMIRGTTLIPMQGEAYLVTDLSCNVNTASKTYDISFDCHGGHYEKAGQLK